MKNKFALIVALAFAIPSSSPAISGFYFGNSLLLNLVIAQYLGKGQKEELKTTKKSKKRQEELKTSQKSKKPKTQANSISIKNGLQKGITKKDAYKEEDSFSSEDDYTMPFEKFMENALDILVIDDAFKKYYERIQWLDPLVDNQYIHNNASSKKTTLFKVTNGSDLLALSKQIKTLYQRENNSYFYRYLPCEIDFGLMFGEENGKEICMSIMSKKMLVSNPYQRSKIDPEKKGRVNTWAELVANIDGIINQLCELGICAGIKEGNQLLAQIMLALYEGEQSSFGELKSKLPGARHQQLIEEIAQLIAEFFTLAFVVDIARFPSVHPYLVSDLHRIATKQTLDPSSKKECYFNNMFTGIRGNPEEGFHHRFSPSGQDYDKKFVSRAEIKENLNQYFEEEDKNKETKKHTKPSGKNIVSSSGGYKEARKFLEAIQWCRLWKQNNIGQESNISSEASFYRNILYKIEEDLNKIKLSIGYQPKIGSVQARQLNQAIQFESLSKISKEEADNQEQRSKRKKVISPNVVAYSQLGLADKIFTVKEAINSLRLHTSADRVTYYQGIIEAIENELKIPEDARLLQRIIAKIKGVEKESINVNRKHLWEAILKKLENCTEANKKEINEILTVSIPAYFNNSTEKVEMQAAWKELLDHVQKELTGELDVMQTFESRLYRDFKIHTHSIEQVYNQVKNLDKAESKDELHQKRYKYMGPIRMHNAVANYTDQNIEILEKIYEQSNNTLSNMEPMGLEDDPFIPPSLPEDMETEGSMLDKKYNQMEIEP